jgi:hypothetical protein
MGGINVRGRKWKEEFGSRRMCRDYSGVKPEVS